MPEKWKRQAVNRRADTIDCENCGNELAAAEQVCKFCGSRRLALAPCPGARGKIRTVNIEAGMPSVEQGIARLENALARMRNEGARVLRVIHGWGSSGKGGKLRGACAALLNQKLKEKRIRALIPGAEYSRSDPKTHDLFRRYPELKKTEKTDRHNPGITMIEL